MLGITRLRCNYLVDPVGIDDPHPSLSWELLDRAPGHRGARQTAWRVTVRTEGGAAWWDSGRVASAQSAHVPYGGRELAPCALYSWRVRVWDEKGTASDWSDEARWTMGPSTPAWRGKAGDHERKGFPAKCWIGAPLPESWSETTAPPALYLRKTFVVARPVRRAVLFASALGVYAASLNGRRAGENVLAPEWTDYHARVQYQGYDVTKLIHQGENALGAVLAPGWYAGQIGLGKLITGVARGYYGRHLRLAAFLLIQVDEAADTIIVTDTSWKVTDNGPIRASDIMGGETYDARREMGGWDTAGFDDSSWTPAAAVQGPLLVAQPNEPIRITQEKEPAGITEPTPGVYVFDMGQNMVGWVRLKLRASEGTDIRMRHAEVLNPDGTIYRDNLRLDPSQPLLGAQQEDHYMCRGAGEETFEPCFTYHGFRYVEVTGLVSPPRPADLVGKVIHSASPEAGSFECSSPELNRVMAAIQWTQRGNMHSIPTDCPQRDERLGWSGDAQVFSQTAMYNRDMAAFLTKWLRDVREAQTLDGRFPDFAPHPLDPAMRASGNPGWADVGVIVPWRAWVEYGDPRFLRDAFDSAQRWVDHGERTFPDLIWKEDGLVAAPPYGDWLNADTFVDIPGMASTGGKVPNEIYGTAFFANSARLVGCMAERLGLTEEARRYLSLARRIRDAFVKAFVRGDGVINGRTQAGYALALAFDLLPARLRAAAARNMVAALGPYHGAPSTGIQSTLRMMIELVRGGYAETAYALLNRREMPSWIYMVEHGGTTIWERWDGWVEGRGFQNPGMNSFNHVAIGSVGEWMWRFIGGIQPDENAPGYANVIVAPVPGGGLTSAKAMHYTIRGPVSVSWRLSSGRLAVDVGIPPNMSATVIIPEASESAVTEGDRPVAASAGVRSVARKAGSLWLQVEPGQYRFVRGAGLPGNRRAVPVQKGTRVRHAK